MNHEYRIKDKLLKILLLMIACMSTFNHAFANVTILAGTGGTNISADKSSNAPVPTYTTLGNIRLTEGVITDFSIGTNVTITLTAPAGWTFNTAAAITSTFTASRDITAATVLSKTSTVITVQITVGGITKSDVLTIAGVQVIASDGANVTGAGVITRGGTATIAGCAAGATLASLSQAVGAIYRLVITMPGQTNTDAATLAGSGITGAVTNQIAGTSFVLTRLTACDQFYNVITAYTGAKTITYSGPSSALTSPTYTTAVTFASGKSSTALTTNLKKAETTTITATDGTVTGMTSTSVLVNPGALSNFLVESAGGGSIGSQIAATSFNIQVTARDAQNNTCSTGPNVFTGTVDITSTGTLSAGSGTTPAFTAGVLASRTVNFSNTGNFTITATKTAAAQTGTSNSFAVTAGVLNNFLVEASAGGNIPSQIAGTSFNLKLTARDANNNACSSGPNLFTGTVDITSTGTLSVGGGTTSSFTAGILASHSVTISNVGSFTITATKTSSSETGTSNSFTVSPGALNNFLVEASAGGNIGTQIAATSFTIKLTARDANNNTCSSGPNVFTGTADITSTGTLSAGSGTTPAFTAGVLASRTVAISNTGSFSIIATKTSGAQAGMSNSFTVDAGALNNFLVEESAGGNISSQVAATSFTIKITARDANNNACVSGPNIFTGTVDITSTGTLTAGSGTTPAFTAGVLASTTINYSNTGNFTITATKTSGAQSGTSNTFTVYAGAINNLLVEKTGGGNIASQISGTSFNIKLTARDANNNICNSGPNVFTGTADITSTGSLSAGSGTTVSFTAGVLASHSVTISDVGSFTITATKTSGAQTGTSNSFLVSPGVVNNFLVEAAGGGSIGSQIVANAFFIKITARDANNNICSSGPNIFSGTADISSNGTLSFGSGATSAFSAGILTSTGAIISNTGNFTITATKTSGVETGSSNSFIVDPAIVNNFLVEAAGGGNIGSQTAGSSFNIKITARDIYNNACSSGPNSFTGKVNVTSTGTLSSGGGTSPVFVAGVLSSHATTISNAGSFTITATRISGSETGTSNSFTVNNPAPTISTISPSCIATGGSTFTLTVNGTNFNNSSVVRFNGANRSTTFINNTQVEATIPSTDILTSAIDIIDVDNPLPGGGTTITRDLIVSLSPVINTQPVSQVICKDSSVTFTATVTGISMDYQWEKNGVPLMDGATITGSNSTTLTIDPVDLSDASSLYTLVISTPCYPIVTSAATSLIVAVPASSTANISICNGQNYTPPGGSAQTVSGTYITHITTVSGCDSIITTNLTVIPNTSSTANISICDGASYTPPGGVAETVSGTYITHINNAAGCDSTITTNLTVIPNTSSTANISICDGASYIPPGGVAETVSGSYITHISNAAGCDSTITTNLTVIPNTSSTANISICDGASYTPPGGSAETTSGTYITHISNAAGCDSTITTNLTVIPNTSSTANISICDGASYTPPGGVAETVSGTYITHISNAAGCDSTITTNLNVIPNTSSTANISICDGASYTPPGGSAETVSGSYITHISNAAGCDSTITTNLTVIPNTSSTANISICDGASYTPPGGSAQTTSGTYITHITNAAGCDSTITTNLTVIPNTSSTANISICDGASYTPPGGSAETTTGTYITQINNVAGCDSSITTNLTVIPNTSSTANISICNGASYTPPGGSAQTISGTYVTHIPNAAGCDSSITTNLTVIPNTSSTANISICDGASYTPPGGVAETVSGTYITHINNAAGCDSTITTNLTVILNTSSTTNISICDGASYTPPGGVAETVSGSYVTHIPNAAGCDSTITTNLTVIPNTSSTANISICDGASYTPPGGSAQTVSGTYITHIPNAAGCDSTITTNLTVIPNTSSTVNISICDGASYTPPGGVAETVSGTYVTHIPNAAGCDSTITTNLTVIPNTSSTANISICDGANYTPPGGVAETVSGTYVTHIPNAAGCDSTITTNLTVIPNTSSTLNISICDGASYTPPGGVAETVSGTYVTHIPNAAGCDSTITTNLTVIPNSSSTANISICDGASYTPPGGSVQTVSGTYITHIPNAAGCDSTITTNLTIIPNTSSTANISICDGASYTPPGGVAESVSGTYVTHISNAAGCDSTITTNLTVIPNTSSTANISICDGASYTPPGGVAESVSGTYVTHISNAAGCDSTITTNLTVIPNTSSSTNISICDSASYTPPGGVAETVSGTYVTHIPNSAGCDSTITTNLTVIPNTSSTANISICDGASYTPPGGVAETVSGTYVTHIPNAAGCDSTITTNLTVIPNTSSTTNISICDGASYTPPGGSAQTTSGTYITHITNAAGCDSTITTNLTVIPNTSSTANISICDGASYTPPGGSAETTTGTYITHINNAAGCDSSITTNLTVIPNTSSTANISICDGASYTPPGGVAETVSGTYITHITNAAGCDSTITTNLTVIPNTSSTANISICDGASYTPPGGVAETVSGTYVTHIPNTAGCDSTITTNLTVIPNTSSTANISICDGASYTPPGGVAETVSGTYVTHIPNAAGCDSTITTNLTVIPNTSSTANISICDGASYTPPGGSAQTTTGSYITHIPNAAGCDSTITTNLTVIPNTSSTANISICDGGSYTPPGGVAETVSGTYVTHIPNAAGCDSTITTNLSVILGIFSSQNKEVCYGKSIVLPDMLVVYPLVDSDYVTTLASVGVAGCDSIITTHVTVNSKPNLIATPNQIVCNGNLGSVTLNTTSGTPAYIYSGASTANLSPGSYTYFVTDSKGCMDTVAATITAAPPVLNFTSTVVQINCFGQKGSVTLIASGGVPPYSFSGSATTNLSPGTYNYTVTDARGCSKNLSVTINAQPQQLVISATVHQIVCNLGKGSVTLSATGGTPGYVFSGAATTNLSAGSYTYIVTDSKGCTNSTSALVAPAPAKLVVTVTTSTTRCDVNTGTASAAITGGSAPYACSWNSNPIQLAPLATGLPAGTYTVLVTDGHGCTASASKALAAATTIAVTITGAAVSCPGGTTALCASTGQTTYLWNTGETTRCIYAGAPGTYTVIGTNASGCTTTANKILSAGTNPVCSITGNDYLCPGGTTVLCGTPGFTSYTWNNGLKAQCRTITAGGVYSVTVTNAEGCTASASATVKAPMTLSSSVTNGLCGNGYLGTATVNVGGPTGPFTYAWSNGATTQSISELNAGTYVATVTDNYGCTGTSTSNVAVTKLTGDYSNINSSFNATVVNPGTSIWFSCVAKISYGGTYPVTIKFTNQNISSSKFNLSPANAKLILTNSVSTASTVFDGSEWITTAPPNLAGEYFVAGYSYPVALTVTANLNPVAWKGIWSATCPGVGFVEWKWAAAAYSSLPTDLTTINVKPVDGTVASPYNNANLAGTPENFTANCISGARGLGGTNYTGSYSGIVTRGPCAPLSCLVNGNPNIRVIEDSTTTEQLKTELIIPVSESHISYNAFPNPFTSKVTIEVGRNDKSCNTTIEIYNITGEKIASIFNATIEQGIKYSVDFNAEDLSNGIYICKIISGEEIINQKLILRK